MNVKQSPRYHSHIICVVFSLREKHFLLKVVVTSIQNIDNDNENSSALYVGTQKTLISLSLCLRP